MKKTGCFNRAMIGLACLGMLAPTPALQAALGAGISPDAGGVAEAVDVALADGGTLRGQVVDPAGNPIAETPVKLWQWNREVAGTVTDRAGYFAVSGLRGGRYQLTAGTAQGAYRLWAANTAPPGARPAALVVAGDGRLVREQGPIVAWLRCHPWLVVGLATAAIAVPIAIHNADDGGPSSPP